MEQAIKNIEKLYANDAWGTYYVNRYYFSIMTNKTREQVGFKGSELELDSDKKMALLTENLPAFLHEFIHYIQETSTIAGHASMINSIYMKAAFTNYNTDDIASCVSLGVNSSAPYVMEFNHAFITNSILDGTSALSHKMYNIREITYENQEVNFPASGESGLLEIPKIHYDSYENGKRISCTISLGRYYLYESIAYEMDQLFEKRWLNLSDIKDPLFRTEYTVGRMLATHISKKIKQEPALAAALLALNYIDCGKAYINILNRLSKVGEDIKEQWLIIDAVKDEVRVSLRKQRDGFYEQQEGYMDIFKNRPELTKAYAYITSINKKFYDMRIENPCFELEWMLDKKYATLFTNAEVCDFIYHFENSANKVSDPEFMRDYLASILPSETSQALKVLIAFDHYFLAHKGVSTQRVESTPKGSHCCPFYTVCMTDQRREHTEICRTKPWRIYDICYPKKNHCWYSSGVMEAKGTVWKIDSKTPTGES